MESSLRLVRSSLRLVESSLRFMESSLRFVESSLRFVNSSFYRKNQVFENACELHRTRYMRTICLKESWEIGNLPEKKEIQLVGCLLSSMHHRLPE